jgi:phosphohistidine swiveling domain-containing protein
MFSNYYRSVDLSELDKRIQTELKKFDIQNYTQNRQNNLKTIQNNQKVLENYTQKLSLELQSLVGFIQDSMKIRDTRKDIYGMLYSILFNQMCSEFEQRNYSKENIYYACMRDVNDGNIDHPDFLQTIEKRRFNGVFDFRSKDIVIYNNYRYQEMKTKLLALNDLKLGLNPENKIIQGNPASLGIATGKVRIIHSENDFKYFEKGDILVTSMTRPETVPLMKIAAAIVTNEGGVTCHAAIVSRELGKPCVVKTKIATEKLKNGDLVEVNADLGIVTILS